MTPAGHLATAFLLWRNGSEKVQRTSVALATIYGALLPDLVDKSILILGLSPYGRTVGHSTLVFGALIAIWCAAGLLKPSRWMSATATLIHWMFIGWASHFVADLADDLVRGLHYNGYLFTAWMGWPLTNPDMWQWKIRPVTFGMEGMLSILEPVVWVAAYWKLVYSRTWFGLGGPETCHEPASRQ